MTGIYLLLGSNLGHRERYLKRALKMLEQQVGPIHVESSMYHTEAWKMKTAPAFLNQVLLSYSPLEPLNTLDEIHKIEFALGRTRDEGYENRTIDIDILYFGARIFNHSRLNIPHPRISQRRFVLEPLTEIAPEFIHPVLKKTNKQLLMECKDPHAVRVLSKQ